MPLNKRSIRPVIQLFGRMSNTDSPFTLTISSASASADTNGSSHAGTDITRRSAPSARASTASPRSGTSGEIDIDVKYKPAVRRPCPSSNAGHPYGPVPALPSPKVPKTGHQSSDGSWIVEGSGTPSTIMNTSIPDVGRGGTSSDDSIMCISNGCKSERALIQRAMGSHQPRNVGDH